ncbi:hypothetical protein EBR96_08570, partial [bacterium]|nr:hypothetical protein [bacterium]
MNINNLGAIAPSKQAATAFQSVSQAQSGGVGHIRADGKVENLSGDSETRTKVSGLLGRVSNFLSRIFSGSNTTPVAAVPRPVIREISAPLRAGSDSQAVLMPKQNEV